MAFRHLDGEEPFVDYMTQAINNASVMATPLITAKIDAERLKNGCCTEEGLTHDGWGAMGEC